MHDLPGGSLPTPPPNSHMREAQEYAAGLGSIAGQNSKLAASVAQVHATLAVAEQLRIANLIALTSLPAPDSHEEVRDLLRGDALHALASWQATSPDDEHPFIRPEIKEELGL